MKWVYTIIGIIVICLMFPLAMTGIHSAQTDSQTDVFPACVVAGTTTDVVLTEDLWGDRSGSVTAITATGAGAVPVAGTYVAATNTLTITGLGADTPQDITVTYDIDGTTDFTGLGEIMGLTPLLIWVAIIGGVLFAGWGVAKSKGWL